MGQGEGRPGGKLGRAACGGAQGFRQDAVKAGRRGGRATGWQVVGRQAGRWQAGRSLAGRQAGRWQAGRSLAGHRLITRYQLLTLIGKFAHRLNSSPAFLPRPRTGSACTRAATPLHPRCRGRAQPQACRGASASPAAEGVPPSHRAAEPSSRRVAECWHHLHHHPPPVTMHATARYPLACEHLRG